MPAVPNSILDMTKKVLGLDSDYDVFDVDVIMHINSAFATLQQLGVGPVSGFYIEDSSKLWTDFILDDVRLNSVKTYIYLKVRSYFDPPPTGYGITALEKQLSELEWRLSVAAESDSIVLPEDEVVIVVPDEPFVPLYYTGG